METLVLQTDFGLVDGAVSAMHGVAKTVDKNLTISDLTHDIPPYDIWSASIRLIQTMSYWPEKTVFVSVVDPGVGSHRRSIAVLTKHNHVIITPDNGTLTHLLADDAIVEARNIDEDKNRLPRSGESYTFHGRDIYAYNGAKIAAGKLKFEDIGEKISIDSLVRLPIGRAYKEGGVLHGNIDILDIRFGSLWSNIPTAMVKELDLKDGEFLMVSIKNKGKRVYQNTMQFVRSFAEVEVGEPLAYVNSLANLAVAINQDSFSKLYNIGYGIDWTIHVRKVDKNILD